MQSDICISESINMNISHQFFKLQNKLCEFTTRAQKLKREFCTLKLCLNVRFKEFRCKNIYY